MNKGRFIVIEGLDGAGKTSAVKFIQALFEDLHIPHVITREPGGTPFAETVRGVMLSDLNATSSDTTRLLLVSAARRDHIEKVIRPALDAGKVVVCDRLHVSTLMYQPDAEYLDELIALGLANTLPDLVLVLDVDFETSKQRLTDRGTDINHFDTNSAEVFNRRRDIALRYAHEPESNCVVIDATGSMDVVARSIDLALQQQGIVPPPQ